jgi:formylglycine-generating enzyme required for sulfatase activity
MRYLIPLLLASLCVSMAAFAKRSERAPTKVGESGEPYTVLRAPGTPMILIRGGHFRMGSTVPELATAQAMCRVEPRGRECGNPNLANFTDELVAHVVGLSDYWLDRTEVSNRAYRRCVDAGDCAPAAYDAAEAWRGRDDLPVTLVTWYDALRFCEWRGARLPTEAEWERAAKGWTGRTFPWGDSYNRKICNHGTFGSSPLDDGDGFSELAPVDAFVQGRTPEGIANLAGNVEEWVNDWYTDGYPEADTVDPKGPQTGDERVIRGSSFIEGRAWMRSANRDKDVPSRRKPFRGFRCAKSDRPTKPLEAAAVPQ